MDKLRTILGIEATKSLYLGMPSQNGRNKSVVFMRIKDRIWKVLQGWKEKLFSAGGKEVLIKAIAQAIPTYTISCFKLPNNMCNELNKVCAKFWWGSTILKNKAHWLSWTKLCTSKDKGGLGFKDLKLFNQALLAKISWRIIKFPNSLLARVLKERYFKGETFLNAPPGSNPSLTWRNIVWGRELFKSGYRWRIGNGCHI